MIRSLVMPQGHLQELFLWISQIFVKNIKNINSIYIVDAAGKYQLERRCINDVVRLHGNAIAVQAMETSGSSMGYG